jgi:hypothetical protein
MAVRDRDHVAELEPRIQDGVRRVLPILALDVGHADLLPRGLGG